MASKSKEKHGRIGISAINKSGRVHPPAGVEACEGGTVVVVVVVVIVRVLMAQIKYDPISRCKPRNNGIDFISISGGGGRKGARGKDEGIGWIGGLNRGKEGRREEGETDKTMVQRKRRAGRSWCVQGECERGS